MYLCSIKLELLLKQTNMKKLFTLFCVLSVMMSAAAQEKVLAFPTADGYGKYVTGGRGGKIYYVTRNDDCTDDELVIGTLRWALRSGDDSPRTILFNTTGTIYLTSKLKMNHPNVSILGQSAPGGGVCVAGYPLNITQDNVIVRYIRFRAGDEPNESLTGLDLENCKNVIIDHCSMTWSMEECLTAYDTDYTTVQWCIIGEGLYNSKNSKGARAYATQWGGEHSTMHHSLITNSHSRSPRFNGVRNQDDPQAHDLHVESEFANNVVFNWSAYNAQYGGENASTEADAYNRVYMINNYYRPGPATKKNTSGKRYFMSGSGDMSTLGEWYLNGNKFETSSKWAPTSTIWSDTELEKVNADNYYGFMSNNASRGVNFWSLSPSQTIYENYLLKSKPELSGLTYESADNAYQKVTSQAGASLPRYDEVDQRLLEEAAGKRDPQYAGATLADEPGIIDSPSDITLAEHDPQYKNYPFLGLRSGEKYIEDSDCDGLPDKYETDNGLNPSDPADAIEVLSSGYTRLETYLNGIVDGSIDKSQYETSTTKTNPNQIPSTVTVSYRVTDETVVGSVPESQTVAYGKSLKLPATNRNLYKDGSTMIGWSRTDYSKIYNLGETITPMEDRILEPAFTTNRTNLEDRTNSVTVVWDFTSVEAPTLEGQGIYVTQATIGRSDIDVCMSYNGTHISIPADEGATVTIGFTDDKQYMTATGKTIEFDVIDATKLEAISVKLPAVEHEDTHKYYVPQPAEGKDFELVYTPDEEFVNSTEWVEIIGDQPRFTSRTCLDPEKDDGITEKVINGITINNSNRIFNAYVTGTATARVFVAGSNSSGDKVVVIATPNDGTPALSFVTMNALAKNGSSTATRSEILELNLDKDKKYQLCFTSENDLDMMLAAIKLYPKEYVEPDAASKVVLTTLVSPENAGSIQRSPAGKRYTPNSNVELTAVAAEGYLFKNWTNAAGDVIGYDISLNLTISEETSVTANFQSYDDYAYIFTNPYYDAEVRTLTELLVALGKAKSESMAGRYRIFLHNGTYDLGQKVMTEVPINVSLIGESMDGVTIVNNPDPTKMTLTNRSEATPTLYLSGDNVYMQDLTVKQAIDYGTGTITGQALAIRARGDRQIFKNVKMLGCQDTYYINKSTIRNYLEDCYIAGDVDFIYGDGTAFLTGCTIYFNDTRGGTSTGVITAPNTPAENQWGLVISDCIIDGPSSGNNKFYLGRPWNDSPAVTYVNNTFKIQPIASGWTSMSPRKVLRFHEFGSKDASGNTLDLSQRSISACRPDASSDAPVMTAEEAARYTVENVVGGTDNWAPQTLTKQLEAPMLSIDGNRLSWTVTENAYCYAICAADQVIAFTRDNGYQIKDNVAGPYTIRVANVMGGLGQPSNSVGTNGVRELSVDKRDVGRHIFNMLGQQVETPRSKGIYLIKGKKYVIP